MTTALNRSAYAEHVELASLFATLKYPFLNLKWTEIITYVYSYIACQDIAA